MTATMKQGQPIAIAKGDTPRKARDGSQHTAKGDTRRVKVRTRPSDAAPARSSTMSSPVAVGPHVKSARPGVLMLTRRSPTATPPQRRPRPDLGHAVRRAARDEHAERAGRRLHHDGVRVSRGSRLGNGVALPGS